MVSVVISSKLIVSQAGDKPWLRLLPPGFGQGNAMAGNTN